MSALWLVHVTVTQHSSMRGLAEAEKQCRQCGHFYTVSNIYVNVGNIYDFGYRP